MYPSDHALWEAYSSAQIFQALRIILSTGSDAHLMLGQEHGRGPMRDTLRQEVSLMAQLYAKDHIKDIGILDNLKRAITELRKRSQRSRSEETMQGGGRKILTMLLAHETDGRHTEV